MFNLQPSKRTVYLPNSTYHLIIGLVFFLPQIGNNAVIKSNQVVKIIWFVSNCHSASKREELVDRLNREENIRIDIYGACGTFKCDKSSGKHCFDTLLPKYDFYLSFENEMCPDYLTEKLCAVLKFEIVPVVLGGADYHRLAPPNSVVNVEDFADVTELAKYLRLLVENPREYQKYFDWKRTHVIENRLTPIFACDLCSKLNEAKLSDEPPNSGKRRNFLDWWNQRKCRGSWKDSVIQK